MAAKNVRQTDIEVKNNNLIPLISFEVKHEKTKLY